MRRLSLVLSLLALAAACGQDQSDLDGPRYQSASPELANTHLFAVHLPHSAIRLYEMYGPLIDYLNRHVPMASFKLETSSSCDDFKSELAVKGFDFALANPRQALMAMRSGYQVIAKMADEPQHSGVIVVRRDSGISQPADLKGKKVAYPSQSCLLGSIMPQYFMQTHGLDIDHDIHNIYVGSHESALMNVYLGNAAAAGAKRQAWEKFLREYPEKANELVVAWETPSLPNSAVIARDEISPRVKRRVAKLLANLNQSEEGRTVLARIPASRFELSDSTPYRKFEPYLQMVELVLQQHKEQRP